MRRLAAVAQSNPRQDFSPCSCSECLGEHKNEGALLDYREHRQETVSFQVEMAALASSASRKLLAGVQGSFSPFAAGSPTSVASREAWQTADRRSRLPLVWRCARHLASPILRKQCKTRPATVLLLNPGQLSS